MATVGTSYVTLRDVISRTDPNQNIAKIAEILSDTNDILNDMPWIEGNLATGHRSTQRIALPSVEWRLLNQGVTKSKSATAQVDDACGILEAWSEIDVDVASLNGNTPEFRLSEAKAFLEAMGQEFASTLFYGTSADPEKFVGMSPRFAAGQTTASDDTTITYNVLNGGGTGSDNTSIWLVSWSDDTIAGIYPKGSKAGIVHEDMGKQRVTDANGKVYQAWVDKFQHKCGIMLKDWRYVVRGCNIDVSDLTKTGSSGADLIDLMVQMLERLPNEQKGKSFFYCNRTVRSFLRRQMNNKANVWLSYDQIGGKKEINIDGVPVHRCDALLNSEAAVTFS